MPDREASPPPRRGAALFRGRGLDWSLALSAVAIGVLLYLLDDRTNWSGGFGFDGRFYGELARNFPSAVFGHGTVIPPGLGHYEGPALTGIDSYYAYRLVPSGLTWLGLQALGLSPTNANVVGAFAGLDALMFGLATFCWCRSADLLGLGDRAKIVGAIGLVVNFSVFRTGGYYPVSTDQVALGLGALSLYLWLRGATVPLVACIVAACFTWPLHLAVGPLLLLFPPPTNAAESLSAGVAGRRPAVWRPTRFGAVVGAITAVVAVASLTAIQLGDQHSTTGTPQLPVFPLSAAIVGIYVFAVVAFLLPRGGLRELGAILRSIQVRRLALAIGVLAGVLIAAAAIARRPGFDTAGLLEEGFWSSTLDPGLFLVLFVGYYGLLMLALLADLPRAAADSWRLGPAMAMIVGGCLLAALLTQPREISDAYAFLVLPGVLAFRRLFGFSTSAILTFLGLSLLLSRIWLPIGDLGTDLAKLTEFPAQSYYMAAGPWTAPSMWAAQLVGVAAVGAAMWLLTRGRRSGGVGDAKPG
jgi:hypothetical protein